jgi:hypothetical protein
LVKQQQSQVVNDHSLSTKQQLSVPLGKGSKPPPPSGPPPPHVLLKRKLEKLEQGERNVNESKND